MNKEIKYGGYTANPNDREALEGDLAVAMNLVGEHGTIRPVLPPSVIAPIPKDPVNHNDNGRKIVCIHQTSAFKHFIVAIEFDGMSPQHPPYIYLYRWDGTEGSDPVRIGAKAFTQVYKVEPVGNTLVVLTDTGLHYYLWKNGAYNYLGDHLPELDLSFSLVPYMNMASDEHEVDLGDNDTPASVRADKDLRQKLCQAVLASANQVTAKAQQKHCFTFPFFVRYAFRLYDESLTMHSAPELVVPTLQAPAISMGWTVTSGEQAHVEGPAKVSATLYAYNLIHHALDGSQLDEVAAWQDIISSIDVYISPQFYTYDQAIKDDDINLFGEKVLPDRDVTDAIRDNGTFHLIKSIKINDVFCGDGATTAVGVNRPSQGRPRANVNASSLVTPDFEPNNDNIVTRELMTDDYGTHDSLIATRSFAYNNRINLAGVSKRLFRGFNPACMWAILDAGQTARQTTATVVIEDGGREIVVTREDTTVYFDTNDTIVWFFYPHSGAKRAYLDIDGTKLTVELTVHAMLNGAYYYGLAGDAVQPQQVDSIPTPSTDGQRTVAMPNKVYTSQVDNPFFFPATGINSISSGEIMGICAAVRPVSTSQYGYADLYIFADNGIWTAKINEKGTYSNITLATGDICINPESITQMETSVLFTTERGIMLISGSQAQCISDAIDDKGMQGDCMDTTVNLLSRLAGLDAFSVDRFGTFLQRCRCLYDYRGQRIIVYNPDYNYAYIYSLESNKWGMMQASIQYAVKDYPKALAVDADNYLVNYSDSSAGDDSAAVNALLVTRPLAFDLPDVHKTVSAVLQRGMFMRGFHLRKLGTLRDGHGAIETVLYGSNDLSNWHTISSSTDENLRGRRGTPFKWFRVALLLRLKPGESVTGCSVTLEPRYTNMLR